MSLHDGWKATVQAMHASLSPEDPSDRIIRRLLSPALDRPSAQEVVEQLRRCIGEERCRLSTREEELVFEKLVRSALVSTLRANERVDLSLEKGQAHPFSIDTLFLPPKSASEKRERFVIAYEVAKDYAEKFPFFNVQIIPECIQVLKDSKIGETIGARLVEGTRRDEPLIGRQHRPDPNKYSFGFLLFCMLFGKDAIGANLDFTRLPAPSSLEWRHILDNIEQHLVPHKIDIAIRCLLTDDEFDIQCSVGILRMYLSDYL